MDNNTNIEKQSRRNISIGTILGYISIIIGVVSGLLFTPWIKDSIGTSQYGLYVLSSSFISLFLLDFGLSTTVTTYLSKYRAKNEDDKIKHFLGLIYKIYFIIDAVILVVCVISYFLIDLIYVGLKPEELISFKNSFAITAAFSIVLFPATTFNGILMSYEKFISIKILDIINKLLYIALTILAIKLKLGLYALVATHALSGLACHIIRYIIIRKRIRVRADFHNTFSKSEIKSIFLFSFWVAIQSIASRFVFNLTPTILGIVTNSREIAIFGIVSTIEGYIYMFGSVMVTLFVPKIARIQNSKNSNEEIIKNLENFSIKVGRIQLFFILLIVLGFIVSGKDFISVWLKEDSTYSSAYYGIIIVSIYHLISIPEGSFVNAMFLKGCANKVSFAIILKALINVSLCFPLSYWFGMLGACISIAISELCELVVINIFYKQNLNVSLGFFFKKTYLPFLIPSIISLIAGLCLHFINVNHLMKFIILGCSFVFLFVLLSYVFVLNKSEKKLLLQKILRKKQNE